MPTSTQVTWIGFDALQRRFENLRDPNLEPLMLQWRQILVEDNRVGVLSGTDVDGAPMPDLRYREGAPIPTAPREGASRGRPSGTLKTGRGGSLTTREYKKLKGPRLAPRGEESRVIANYQTQHGRDQSQGWAWFAEGYWEDVVSKDGVPFLKAHFEGEGHLPKYNLLGLREWGRRAAREAMVDFVRGLLRRR